MPTLLEAHIVKLRERGDDVEVIEDGSRYLVVLRNYRLPDGRYQPQITNLMVMADYQYPMSRMDMFWTEPHVLLTTGGPPQNADQFEVYAGRRWQRWSWHYPTWDPNRHSVLSHIEVCRARLALGN